MTGEPGFHHADGGSGVQWPDTTLWREALERARSHTADVEHDPALGDAQRLCVMVAHPDDETLAAGGLIARAARLGLPVRIVTATLGEASHPASPTHTPGQLAALRARELRAAAAHLAPQAEVRVLGLPDGGLADHADALRAAAQDAIAWAGDDGLIVTTFARDGHGDHEAVALAVREALARAAESAGADADAGAAGDADATAPRHLEAPIWLWHWATEGTAEQALDGAPLVVVELSAREAAAKRTAMGAHASQIEPLSLQDGDETLLGPEVTRHFASGCEVFVDVGAREEPGESAGEGVASSAPNEAHGARSAALTFDELHRDTPDPWHVRSRWYEARKRAVTLASLPAARYGRVLEVGSSIGELARDLATRADDVLAIDASRAALAEARRLSAAVPGLRFERAEVPHEWPEGERDCVVLSEVGYFLTADALAETARRARASLAEGGVIVSVNWQHEIDGWPLNGADVDDIIARETGLTALVEHLEADFVLRVFGEPGGRSDAAAHGDEDATR